MQVAEQAETISELVQEHAAAWAEQEAAEATLLEQEALIEEIVEEHAAVRCLLLRTPPPFFSVPLVLFFSVFSHRHLLFFLCLCLCFSILMSKSPSLF